MWIIKTVEIFVKWKIKLERLKRFKQYCVKYSAYGPLVELLFILLLMLESFDKRSIGLFRLWSDQSK